MRTIFAVLAFALVAPSAAALHSATHDLVLRVWYVHEDEGLIEATFDAPASVQPGDGWHCSRLAIDAQGDMTFRGPAREWTEHVFIGGCGTFSSWTPWLDAVGGGPLAWWNLWVWGEYDTVVTGPPEAMRGTATWPTAYPLVAEASLLPRS